MTQKDLVLSLFPGLDLLGRAFELEGYTVVRGPDKLWGGDIQNFHISAGVFAGIIGGAPCQSRSQFARAGFKNISREDLLPELIRIYNEGKPQWLVMENVAGFLSHPDIPVDWFPLKLRDWDCGGLTMRRRVFWIYPCRLILSPSSRPGKPELTVLASSWKNRGTAKHNRSQQTNLTTRKAATLQGWPDLIPILKGLPRAYAVNLLGNGVPTIRSMTDPCPGYSPRKPRLEDFRDCESDGHYLCAECCHRRLPEPITQGERLIP